MNKAEKTFTMLIKSTEVRKTDFKKTQYLLDNENLKSKFVKDILCMANAPGKDGYILLGVREEKGRPREVVGISCHHDSSELEQIVNGVVEEPIQFEYIPLTHEGRECALFHIPRSKSGPHWPKRDYGVLKKNVFYTRRASGNREASLKEVRDMFVSPDGGYDFTAEDLVRAGFKPGVTSEIVNALSIAQEEGNERLSQFLQSWIEIGERSSGIPEGWRSLISGFPILSEDIGAPSLGTVVEAAKRISPWVSNKNREEYHKIIRPLLGRLVGEVQAFLSDAAAAGGFPLVIHIGSPNLLWRLGLKSESGPYRIEDSILKGIWSYGIPSVVHEKLRTIRPGNTWSGLLFDMVSRLPDPDRQRGSLLGKAQLSRLLYHWCATDPKDFYPPLDDIKRTPYKKFKGTVVGMYLDMGPNGTEKS